MTRPTSDEAKKAGGTYRPILSRTPLGIPIAKPIPPDWLSIQAKAVWDNLIPDINRSGVLTKADWIALSTLCELTAEYAENPRGMMSSKLTEMRMIYKEFGCTISSRLSIKSPEGIKPIEDAKPCQKTEGNVVNISELLSSTRKTSSLEKLRPADMSASPAKDS